MDNKNHVRGMAAERAAAEWLMARGYGILHTNWRSGRYEIDIVAERGDTLHLVEVKCRRPGSLTAPEDAITPAKFAALQKAAAAYIALYAIDLEVQFDLMAMTPSGGGFEVRYVPGAMTVSW
ncbi:MAG: YraN family protein [Rikenellaceae bacterium]|nr:YraN family protein [Rikenellaceae bacterium]MCL2693103.1 YraN family protein [Rikenellaceae bacterium]